MPPGFEALDEAMPEELEVVEATSERDRGDAHCSAKSLFPLETNYSILVVSMKYMKCNWGCSDPSIFNFRLDARAQSCEPRATVSRFCL